MIIDGLIYVGVEADGLAAFLRIIVMAAAEVVLRLLLKEKLFSKAAHLQHAMSSTRIAQQANMHSLMIEDTRSKMLNINVVFGMATAVLKSLSFEMKRSIVAIISMQQAISSFRYTSLIISIIRSLHAFYHFCLFHVYQQSIIVPL